MAFTAGLGPMPINPATVALPNPAWVYDRFQNAPRLTLELQQECLSCLAGECDEHNFFDFKLAMEIERRIHPARAAELFRRWGDLTPELARMVLEKLPPMTFYSIIEVEPFKSICPDDKYYVGGDDHYPEAKHLFPAEQAHETSAPGQLLFGPGASLRYKHIFWDCMTYLTEEITHYLHATLGFEDRYVDHYRTLVWHMWRFFGNMHTIPTADLDQEPWTYFCSLSAATKIYIQYGLRALGVHFLAKYPIQWPAQLSPQWKAELENHREVKTALARFRAIEWLRVGMTRAHNQLMGPRPRGLRLPTAFGFHRGCGPEHPFGQPWENIRQPALFAMHRMHEPGDVVFIDKSTYRVRFRGRAGRNPVTNAHWGHIQLIAPWVDPYYALKYATHAFSPTGGPLVFDWAQWSALYPQGTIIKRFGRPWFDGLNSFMP